MPYGKIECVEETLMNIRSQKYQLPIWSPDGKNKIKKWIPGQLRVLPFGFYEHVFPKEYLDIVLTTLGNEGLVRHKIPKLILSQIRKILQAKEIPEYKTINRLLWQMDNVHIFPIGIREDDPDMHDGDLTGEHKGWHHEGL